VCLIIVIAAVGLVALLAFFATVGFALSFLPLLLVGLLVGAVASAVTESKHGAIGDIVIGLVGSVVGGILFSLLFHVHPRLLTLQGVVAALVGAVVLLLVLKAVRASA
jgi:uncharacterized membrane protein YeaQ/YmgE (transglycosylase-associated protein family)